MLNVGALGTKSILDCGIHGQYANLVQQLMVSDAIKKVTQHLYLKRIPDCSQFDDCQVIPSAKSKGGGTE